MQNTLQENVIIDKLNYYAFKYKFGYSTKKGIGTAVGFNFVLTNNYSSLTKT